MANGFTPAIQSGDAAQLKAELATVLLALRRLRADLASGRVTRDGQFLSVAELDELLQTLCPPALCRPAHRSQPAAKSPPRPAEASPPRLERSKNPAASWNALAQAVG